MSGCVTRTEYCADYSNHKCVPDKFWEGGGVIILSKLKKLKGGMMFVLNNREAMQKELLPLLVMYTGIKVIHKKVTTIYDKYGIHS